MFCKSLLHVKDQSAKLHASFMPPCTPHYVLTAEACFAFGGHFLCSTSILLSLYSYTFEHYFGEGITNTQHTSSPLLYFKMLADMEEEEEEMDRRAATMSEGTTDDVQPESCEIVFILADDIIDD